MNPLTVAYAISDAVFKHFQCYLDYRFFLFAEIFGIVSNSLLYKVECDGGVHVFYVQRDYQVFVFPDGMFGSLESLDFFFEDLCLFDCVFVVSNILLVKQSLYDFVSHLAKTLGKRCCWHKDPFRVFGVGSPLFVVFFEESWARNVFGLDPLFNVILFSITHCGLELL